MKHFITGLLVGTFLLALFAQDPAPVTPPDNPSWEETTWDKLYEYIDATPAAQAKFEVLEDDVASTPANTGNKIGFNGSIGTPGWVELVRNAYDGSYILEAWGTATTGESAYIKVWYEWRSGDSITAYVLEHSKRGTNVFSQLVFGYESPFPRSVIATSTLTFLTMKVVVTEAGSADSGVVDTSNTGRIISNAYTNILNLSVPLGNFPAS